MRLRLGSSVTIFTQDCIYRGERVLPLFDRVLQASSAATVVWGLAGEKTMEL